MNKIAASRELSQKEVADFQRLHLIVSKWLEGWEGVAAALLAEEWPRRNRYSASG